MIHRHLRHVAWVGEQPQIEGRKRRESKIVARVGVDRGAAAQIADEPGSEAVVEISGLRLDQVPWRAAPLPGGIPVKIVEVQARSDTYLVCEGERIGEPRCYEPTVTTDKKASAATSFKASAASNVHA